MSKLEAIATVILFTIQCDPQTVQTLIGDNNVWGGSGVSIDYYADTKLYIEKMLGA